MEYKHLSKSNDLQVYGRIKIKNKEKGFSRSPVDPVLKMRCIITGANKKDRR